MVFENFPYTNFHDLNLDWIIKKFEEWGAQWAEVKAAYEQFNADFTELVDDIEALQVLTEEELRRINNLEAAAGSLDTRLTNLNLDLDALAVLVSAGYHELDNKIAAIETSATFYMFSPFTGAYEPLEDVILELAQFHLADALTATEYDTLDMSASYYDGKQLTAIQYDSSGKTLLP